MGCNTDIIGVIYMKVFILENLRHQTPFPQICDVVLHEKQEAVRILTVSLNINLDFSFGIQNFFFYMSPHLPRGS